MRKTSNNQIFTPKHIVLFMLDVVDYQNEKVLYTRFMEPSFGDGAFLIPMVERIIKYALSQKMSTKDIVDILYENVHGIEMDRNLYTKAIYNLNELLNLYGIEAIDWSKNLICGNTLVKSKRLKNRYDLVIGNPPFTKIHHMNKQTKKLSESYEFSKGMRELYILFYEAGLNMLNKSGVLCYITPNSFMYNTSQQNFRKYLIENHLLDKLYDFKSKKVFEGVDTYTCILKLVKNETKNFLYFNAENSLPGLKRNVDMSMYINGNPWYFDIKINKEKANILGNKYNVQYGIATNADKVFIAKAYIDEDNKFPVYDWYNAPKLVYFNGSLVESSLLKPCVKASTYNGVVDNTYAIFPYVYTSDKCELISEDILKTKYPYTYKYFLRYQKILNARNTDEPWYAYGRTQGLLTMNQPKIVFKHILPNDDSLVLAFELNANVLVYSGLFITKKDIDLSLCAKNIQTLEFKQYCRSVGKPMSNNYISINGKNVKSYPVD